MIGQEDLSNPPPRLGRRTGLAAAMLALALRPARAQGSRATTRIVVPYAPGGTNDVTARLIAPSAGERLGQNWIIENRSGANGAIGADAVMRSQPDGHTLLYSNDVIVALKHVQRGVTFDLVNDFTPIIRVMNLDFVLVGSARSVTQPDITALIAAIRQSPNLYSFASSTLGAVGQIAPAALAQALGSDLTIVGYRGSGPAINDLIAGNVALGVLPVGLVLPMLAAGQLKAFATTSAQRLEALPDLPTMSEAGFPTVTFVGWNAIWGPRGLAVDTARAVHAAVTETLKEPVIGQRLAQLGCTPIFETQAEFAAMLSREGERYGAIISAAGISPE